MTGSPSIPALLDYHRDMMVEFSRQYPDAFRYTLETLGYPTCEPRHKTLRDEFAMAALTGLLSTNSDDSFYSKLGSAQVAYEFADAMLAERERKA